MGQLWLALEMDAAASRRPIGEKDLTMGSRRRRIERACGRMDSLESRRAVAGTECEAADRSGSPETVPMRSIFPGAALADAAASLRALARIRPRA
jgi:hypothetical protein